MEIKVKQGRWTYNGKDCNNLQPEQLNILDAHLAFIRNEYYMHHENPFPRQSRDCFTIFGFVVLVLSIATMIANFIKFIVNQPKTL